MDDLSVQQLFDVSKEMAVGVVSREYFTIPQYSWGYFTESAVYRDSGKWFFSLGECLEDVARSYRDSFGNVRYLSRHVPSPTHDQMAVWVYKYLIRNALLKHMRDNWSCFR